MLYINYFSSFFVIVPLIIGLILRIFTKKGVLFIYFLTLFSFFIEILNITFAFSGHNNLFLQDIYTPVEFILFALFYRSFFDSFSKSPIHFALIGAFVCVAIFDSFFVNDFFTINNFSDSLEAVVFILYSLTAFFFIMKRLMFEDLLNTAFFWINIAILIYFAGNLFLFMFSNYLQNNDRDQYLAVYNIHSITNIIYYILISIGFWKSAKK